MRIGTNPEKVDKNVVLDNYHRVVIPVYIPHFREYFEDSLNVFKLCLESLLLTSHSKTRITIFNNNSCKKVKDYIDDKYKNNDLIDQVFHSKNNIGKINAYLSAVKGNLEQLITVTDSDVLFKNGWQEAVELIFNKFPEAGMVSPVPSSKSSKGFTANNWFYSLFKGKLNFDNVIDSEAMQKFDLSLGNKKMMYSKEHLKKYMVLINKKNNARAVMGCGHFVATIDRSIFDKGTNEPSVFKIDGGIENKFLDIPNERLGFLRLATKENYAYHMGNVTEAWMYDQYKRLRKNNDTTFTKIIKREPLKRLETQIGRIYLKLLKIDSFKNFLLKRNGLGNPRDYDL